MYSFRKINNITRNRHVLTQHLYYFADDLADSSTYSKSATPSPAMSGTDGRGGRGLPHGVQATKEVLRDFRESSVNSRSSTGSASAVGADNTIATSQDTEFYDVDAVASATRDQKSPERYPSPYNNRQHHHGSMSSLGVRIIFHSRI